MKIKVEGSYCEKSGDNFLIEIDKVDFYFSFKTVIAFRIDAKLFIRENDWGPKTGRHLNAINKDPSIRLKSSDFENLLDQIQVKVKGDLVLRLSA